MSYKNFSTSDPKMLEDVLLHRRDVRGTPFANRVLQAGPITVAIFGALV